MTRIGLDNGLAPNRRQAIIWTNAQPIHGRIYAALGGDELIYPCNTNPASLVDQHFNTVVVSMNLSSTYYVSHEHDDEDQFIPHAIPSGTMHSCKFG